MRRSVVVLLLILLPVWSVSGQETGVPPAGAHPDDLVSRALDLAHSGRKLEAWEGLLGDLHVELPAAGDDALLAAQLEVAALVLESLTADLGTWPETLTALQPLRPFSDATPAGANFRLERLVARCQQRIGYADRARANIDRLGFISEFYIAGPFDNERGSGFDLVQPPEERFERGAEMPGKERPVAWRWTPARHHPLALTELHEILRPNTQAVAYLATSLRPLEAGFRELRVGSSGSYKLFLNGELVGSRKLERRHTADQDRHLVWMRAGWNSLLIKAGTEDGPWTIDVRVTHPDGRPARLACEAVYTAWPGPPPSEDEAALIFYGVEPEPREAEPLATPDPALPGLLPGTRETLEQRRDDAHAMRLLTAYHLLVQPEDNVDATVIDVAQRAVDLEPSSVLGRYLLARALEPRGRSRNEMAANRRLHALDAVLDADPSHVSALLDRARFFMEDNPIPTRADELTQRALEVAPGSWAAHRLRGRFLDSRMRTAEADWQRRAGEDTLEASLSSDGLLARARRLTSQGRPDVALVQLKQAVVRNLMYRPMVDEVIRRLADEDELLDALSLAEQTLTANPFDVSRLLTTADYLEHGNPVERSRGRELLQRALALCPENLSTLRRLVRVDERAGDQELATENLRRILELDPADTVSRRHLDMLTAGQERRFEQPFRWDATELVGTPMPDLSANDPLEVLRRTVVWQVNSDGTEHEYQHVAMRVLNEGGARRLDAYPVVGEAASRPYVYNARVLRVDGSIESAPSPRSRGRSRLYDLPPLSIGDIVDIEYRFDQSRADVFGEYFGTRHVFYPDRVDGLAPTRLSELVVIAAPDVPIHFVEKNTEGFERSVEEDDAGMIVRRWVGRDLERPSIQSAMPSTTEFLPLVDVTTFRDWDEMATWWWHFIEKEFVTTPAMRKKVAELTDGLDTEAEKVQAIVRFVGQEIRYNAWAFGTHGYEPYSAATIFERRFGDCKDKSILLRQMLAEVDVEALPVLIKAESPRAKETLDAAMVGHFNHCIAWLPPTDEREGYYVDATADRNPIEYLRQDDQGARVLHVQPEGGELHDIPYAPAGSNSVIRRYDVALDDAGRARVEMHDTSSGSYGVGMRYRYGGEQGDVGQLLSRRLSAGFGPVEVVDVETSDLEDIGVPAEMTVVFEADDLWSSQGALKALPVGFDGLGLDGVAQESSDSRTYETVLDRPFAHDTLVTYVLPDGARAVDLPADVRVEVPGYLEYEQQVRSTPAGVEVRRRFSLHEHRVPIDDYAVFRDALQRVRLAETREIQIVTGDQP